MEIFQNPNHTNLMPAKSTLILLIFSFLFVNCSEDSIDGPKDFTNISVRLKSTSSVYGKVYLDIEGVQLRVKSEDGISSFWTDLNTINIGTHNACDLDESSPLILVDDEEIRADYVFEIRLVLGDNNFININNVLHNLDVSELGNALPSNLIETQLNAKRRYDMVVDINIDQSISFDADENTMVLDPILFTAIRQIEY